MSIVFTNQLARQKKPVSKIVKSSTIWHRGYVKDMVGPAIGQKGHKLEPGPAGVVPPTTSATATNTFMNITEPTVVSGVAGRLVTVSLLQPGFITVNDSAILDTATSANQLVTLTMTNGGAVHLDMPVTSGIVVSAISGQAAISYQ